jgi:hypothetical protein
MSLDGIIFVRRQSPDWAGLARDYAAGLPIDPARYIPQGRVPGFPDDIAACIRTWNDTFPVNFFRCRQVLKEISQHSLRRIASATVIPEQNLHELPADLLRSRFFLFFFDDDDLFAPDSFERLSVLDPGVSDVVVFPLVRLGEASFTFVRQGEVAREIIGFRRNFGHRFQTNNYALTAAIVRTTIARTGHLLNLKDHVLASVYADQQNLRDTYFDSIVSATNKTPCSANTVGSLLSDRSDYRSFIRRYVANLRRLPIPRKLNWLAEPMHETIKLFSDI